MEYARRLCRFGVALGWVVLEMEMRGGGEDLGFSMKEALDDQVSLRFRCGLVRGDLWATLDVILGGGTGRGGGDGVLGRSALDGEDGEGGSRYGSSRWWRDRSWFLLL